MQRRQALAKLQEFPAGKEADWAGALDRVVCAEDALDGEAGADAAAGLLEPIFSKGLEMGPAFAVRGRMELGKGRLTAALADAERAVKLCPREAGGYYVRGQVRLERNDLPGALADLEKAGQLTESHDADVLHAWASGPGHGRPTEGRPGRPAEGGSAQAEEQGDGRPAQGVAEAGGARGWGEVNPRRAGLRQRPEIVAVSETMRLSGR